MLCCDRFEPPTLAEQRRERRIAGYLGIETTKAGNYRPVVYDATNTPLKWEETYTKAGSAASVYDLVSIGLHGAAARLKAAASTYTSKAVETTIAKLYIRGQVPVTAIKVRAGSTITNDTSYVQKSSTTRLMPEQIHQLFWILL